MEDQELKDDVEKIEAQIIKGIIDSEKAVQEVIKNLDDVSVELKVIGQCLNEYNSHLQNMKPYIEHIESRNNNMESITKNQKQLLEEIEKIIYQNFYLDDDVVTLLRTTQQFPASDLNASISAARSLESIFTCWNQLKPEMQEMKSIREKYEESKELNEIFTNNVANYMQQLFSKLSISYLENRNKNDKVSWSADSHSSIFRSLQPYNNLGKIIRKIDKNKTNKWIQSYFTSMKTIYKKEMKDFFTEVKHSIIKESKNAILSGFFNMNSKKIDSDLLIVASSSEKITIDQSFFQVLEIVVPVVNSEHTFCIEFFELSPINESKIVDSNYQSLMENLFEGLNKKLLSLIETADKYDHLYPLIIMGHIEHQLISETISPFISRILSVNCEQKIKQLFNKFIDDQIELIQSTQVTPKGCGIVPFIYKFPEFVQYMEFRLQASKMANKNTVRLSVDNAYNKLMICIFAWLKKLGEEDTTKFKYIARFENFHYIATHEALQKVPSLSSYLQQANELFQETLASYLELIINNKFKHLTQFFNAIDLLLKSIPATEIQFQQSHSKQMLNKLVIEKTTQTWFEKQFHRIFKSMNKHLSEDEKILRKTWNAFSNRLLEKFKHYEDLLNQCYHNQKFLVSSEELTQLTKQYAGFKST